MRNMKKEILLKATLKHKLLCAFRSTRKPLAAKIKPSKLMIAVSNIASRKLLHLVLKTRKQSVSELLGCIRSVDTLKMSAGDFGESRHTASTEPFFYDQSYSIVKHTSPIVLDDYRRCVIAEEEGERDKKKHRPLRWKCTSECKHPTSDETKCILATKALVEKPVVKLREGLNNIDMCSQPTILCDNTDKLNTQHEQLYRELAGHRLSCSMVNSDCESSLRILRAAATHFPLL